MKQDEEINSESKIEQKKNETEQSESEDYKKVNSSSKSVENTE